MRLRQGRSNRARIIIGVCCAVAIGIIGSVGWYFSALQPYDSKASGNVSFVVAGGSSVDAVAKNLAEQHLIRSQFAYSVYIRLHPAAAKLQAGVYSLSPSMSVADIAQLMSSGKQQSVNITFYPGATLYDARPLDTAKRTDVATVLKKAGYSDADIKTALAKQYQSPLFQDKPSGTTLEGYVYGDTYRFNVGTPVETVLQTSFDTFWQEIEDHDIVAQAKKHGLNLYQAITLASIIQREVHDKNDMKQVAQVFYARLGLGMELGSDVTYIYVAHQQNIPESPDIVSPYNTRLHKGLPPGPIAIPSIDALDAVANPASGDYLYFVAGEDGKTYFSHTLEEHEQNVAAHCGSLCR